MSPSMSMTTPVGLPPRRTNSSVGGTGEKRESSSRPIRLSGQDRSDDFKTLRGFFWIGLAYDSGAVSLRDASRNLKAMQGERRCPLDIPTNPSDISENADKACRYFGLKYFHLGTSAVLFVCDGKGHRFRDLSDLGWIAWELTRDFVVPLGETEEIR